MYWISSHGQPTRSGLPGWGLGEGLITLQRKNVTCYEMLKRALNLEFGLILWDNGRRVWHLEFGLILWHNGRSVWHLEFGLILWDNWRSVWHLEFGLILWDNGRSVWHLEFGLILWDNGRRVWHLEFEESVKVSVTIDTGNSVTLGVNIEKC